MGEEDISAQDKKKSHRERHSGRKAEKKKGKKDAINPVDIPDKQRNPKAFAFNSAIRAERRFRRKQDIQTKKQHIPIIDRTPIEPPPILIAIVGPPKVGKSTVINNLIKLFTRSPLTDIKGPVTIVTGKKRRITLIECNNDINSMIDIAKVADLVLLLCDASFGFEMEIFEFLNICQVHGMPRIMGVLTHLDMIKNSKTLKNTKKVLKHRFWTEVYPGAKLFYLSGILHGEYLRNEINNLGRFISIIKFRPLTWRTTHSYLLGDRYEDLTSQELVRQNPKCDRTISLYGYVRGVPLVKNTSIHIAGLGDLKIHDISYLPDPCPLPSVLKKRSLIEKEKCIYAPFSGVGGIVYDKDAVYVELGGSHSHKNIEDNESKSMVSNLIETKETLDIKMQHSEMQIFTGGKKLTAKDMKDNKPKSTSKNKTQSIPKEIVDSDLDEELDQLRNDTDYSKLQQEVVVDSGRTRRKVIFDQQDSVLAESLRDSSDSESDEGFDQNKHLEYTMLKENKDKDVHDKVKNALKYLNYKSNKNVASTSDLDQESEIELSENEDASDESEEELEKDSRKSKTSKSYLNESSDESDNSENDESDVPDDISLKSNESLVNVSKMKKKKDKIVDIDIVKLSKNKAKKSTLKTAKLNKITEIKSDSEDSDDESIKSEVNSDTVEDSITLQSSKSNEEDMEIKDESDLEIKDSNIEESESSDDSLVLQASKSNEEINESEDSDDENMAVKWKENLGKKARDAFLDRQRTTQNIMKLVYGVFDKHGMNLNEEHAEEVEDKEDIGSLFRVVTSEQKRIHEEKEKMNALESSLFQTWDKEAKDWLNPENKILINNCFVTGKWKQSEDASELLKLDEMKDFSDNDSEIFGDFEDLETGEKHSSAPEKGEKRKRDDSDTEEPTLTREELVEKKRKLKEKFDSEYDNTENTSYYDDLKTSAEKQAQLNKEVFDNMPDDLRVQIEGYRPGMYVRIEFQDVPSEFISNFDPTYPILLGGLNIGEENIGYVNVKIKKHRWYKKILKTGDPLIVSLGWRRFQTLPLFSKLEDDLKYRYLKYTPEHVNCNAHFWGPITPQGTGFLAIKSCGGQLEDIKTQGFRITATGSVQELEKSTQIMKKLKLIGYPLKIYKKTAFIKDMFNSALEVAKFEGARIKTVSGIRGQIKKASNKPEGSFRATFEDKIILSDIVFCRTWYKVDVPKFYCPITTLLLPLEEKNSWKGVRTTGQLKRELGIRNEPNLDSLYTEVVREPKVFKPLVIPRKLQRELPYRDKPKFAPLKSQRKPDIEKKRVAVVREPHEQHVAQMLKMLRASYENKQAHLKAQMSERMEMHKLEVEARENKKQQREKEKKKEVFRKKTKAKIIQDKKGGKK